MSVIDDYLKKVESDKRKELERIRTLAKKIVPDSQEVIKYGMPTLTFKGQAFLGFDAHKEHIGIYPYSGEVVDKLKDKLDGKGVSKGAIRLPLEKPISEDMLKLIILTRLDMIKRDTKNNE